MRAFTSVVVFVFSLFTVSAASADSTVVLLGLRSVEGDDEFANQLTAALREQAAKLGTWEVSDRNVSLAQMSLAYGCEELDAACLTEIAVGLQANRCSMPIAKRLVLPVKLVPRDMPLSATFSERSALLREVSMESRDPRLQCCHRGQEGTL